MKILSSHLAMRFYRNCGWTESLLESCLKPESKLLFREDWVGDHDIAYWLLQVHSHFDLEKLKPHITEIRDYKGAVVPENEWDSFLHDFNW
jgi:hypothetical protein